ncbi:IS66 family transposase [Metabacillus litoralis]|jgi:hypothetical protein|uniref:IS66 family transposase n=1 Tax=Metabacillus litoralis TaxID=152268 RepID=UPI00203A7D65|nr:transposase [Metabacillus litoralis]
MWAIISQGTIHQILMSVGEKLAPAEEQLRDIFLQSPLAHADETGIRHQGKTDWVHTFSTKQFVLQAHHAKRGQKAMDDIGLLPAYQKGWWSMTAGLLIGLMIRAGISYAMFSPPSRITRHL